MKTTYQYIIVGSGLIGATTAIALAQSTSEKIALIDAHAFSLHHSNNSLDTRTIALNAASIRYLQSLDLWYELEPHACPIKYISISERGAFGSCLLRAEDVEEKYLGQVVEIKNLQAALFMHLKKYSNIIVLPKTQVSTLEKITKGWTLTLEREGKFETLKAKQVILADGTHSKLRDSLDIKCKTFNYDQTAIVAIIQPTLPHQNTAYERFAGPYTLAVLPLTEGRVGTVLSLPQIETKKFLALESSEYQQKIYSLFGARLGSFLQLGPRQSYPLQEVIADKFVLKDLVLLGNTAHTFNPVGAQGLNLGLSGVKDYVETLLRHESLKDFETRQKQRCEKLKKFTRETVRAFNSENFPTRLARRWALFALQHGEIIKKRFTRRMMGY